MKKHLSRALAMLLVLAMVLTMLPIMAFATNVGEGAAFFKGLPTDGSYGVIYSCGEGYSAVMGYDIINGDAAVKQVELTDDGEAIKSLPDGTMIIKFVQTGSDYYFMVGNKYLVLKDLGTAQSDKEKLVLADTAEHGAKWTIKADAYMAGAYTIMNAEYKYNGKYDVYLEQYNNSKFCGYSYSASTPQYFQFKFAETSADPDGRVGELVSGAELPKTGDTVVIHNAYAKAVFGQPAEVDEAAKPNLTGAPAKLNADGTISYENIGDGALIFTVTVEGNEYTFQTKDTEGNIVYLGMPDNYKDDSTGKLMNDESLILRGDKCGYTSWTVSEINGGWLMKNKEAQWKGYPVYIEFFNDLFAGYSYDSSNPKIFAMNFYKVTDKYNCGYVVNPSIELETPFAAIGSDSAVKFTVKDLNALKSITGKYTLDNGAAKTVTPEMNNKVGSFTIPAADLEGHKTLKVEVTATDSMDLTFSASTTIDIVDEPLILAVSPAANTATGDEKKPEITATFANVGTNPKIELTLDGAKVTPTVTGDTLSYKPAAALSDGKHSATLSITRTDGKSVVKNWSFFVGAGGETLYFGQIHTHTAEYSDGAGTLEQAYEHAHEVDNMDFMIVTDHSNYFDSTSTATESSYYDLSSLSKNAAGTTTKWEEARATAKEYNELYDDFLCVYGYEMTWSGGPGHTNSFNTYGVVSRNNSTLNNKTNYAGMLRYNDIMVYAEKGLDVNGAEASTTRNGETVTGANATKYIPFDEDGNPVPVISQFNHPGITFGNFGNFTGYTSQRDDVLNLVEVGNGEGKVGGSSYFPSYEQYDLALSMGWHIGPTNNQDNHKGNFGDANTCRDVILTDDFSEIGLYRALDARRIYATEDQNLEIYYELKVGDTWYKLGDIANVDEDNQPAKVTAKVTVNDPDATDSVGTVYIIGENGKTLYSEKVSGGSFSKEITIDNTDAYYYIKVVEGDGDIAVTAPVWTKESVPAAVEAETDAAVAAQGVEENVIATFTNGSETESMHLLSYAVKYQETGKAAKVIAEAELKEDLAAGAQKQVKVPFTPPTTDPEATMSYALIAEFTFTYKEKEYTYTATVNETSYPPSQMTYIGLDRGHKNFYVSGDYASNETSFIQICADNGIICEYINEGEMTAEKLAKYKMVVITVPRINETTMPPVFTEDELAALKNYADNGGNILNFSKSDRADYEEKVDGADTYKYASATMSNAINEAIGAKARFIRGIVVDNEKKSNEAYRIYFDGAELLAADHPFTQAIFRATNGQYQWYNGTGISMGDGVTALVSPYASSWVASYKANFTGSAYVPDYDNDTVMAKKGDFALVTYEKLPGGGFLVCAGATFISAYDLKTDTPANEQYENYQLVLNILEYVKNNNQVVKPKITPIADVHNGKVNQQFTIEGWITSNASDYDKDTAFFDCVYIQDKTRGINAFPVSGYYYIGEKVQAHGAVTYYCGEIELNLSPDHDGWIKVVSNDLNILQPKKVSCKNAMSDANIGNLMQISGVVRDIHRTEGVIDYIYVDDGSGEIAALFINAYIQGDYKGLDDLKVGMSVTGVGIGSRDADENDLTGQTFIKRLRVRSREEIVAYYDPCAAYTDINRSAWYHEGVDFAISNGIMKGVDLVKMRFSPDSTTTRAQLVTMLYRMEGEPAVSGKAPFVDVPAGQWYSKAVKWAYDNGITKGTSATNFSPDSPLTRQALATLIYRYAQFCNKDVSARADLAFPDKNHVDRWALDAMQWAVAVGLIKGVATPDGTFLRPTSYTTRAQIATILMRFSELDIADADDIVILYTNDVHCGIDNTTSSFGYAGLAGYKADMEATYNHVGLVDAGDYIQGEAIGSLSAGSNIIDIMNEVGYEYVTLGNHEFDYGVDNIFALMEKADFEFLASNFKYTGPETEGNVVDLAGYAIAEYGDTKVAYVGIVTPESLVKSTPTYFQDADGNWIYDFCNDATGAALYAAVQEAVDAAKAEGADYVVALSHLGVDEGSAPWRSTDVIRNTNGIDVVLDGHSHSVIPSQKVSNKDGETVLLSSTGTKLANIGKLVIKENGTLTTELVTREGHDGVDKDVESFINNIKAKYEELLSQVVVKDLAASLTVNNPDRLDASGNPVRAVRYQETNLGDVCADAYLEASGADIAFVNGGGIRADIKAGDVTFNDIIAVHPFGNELAVVETTGQQILDALEMAARFTYINDEGLVDGENGGFLQVSGLKYTVYTGTASTVKTDTAAMFESVEGDRRVGNVEVYNKTTGEFEPIDPNGTYTLASHNYMLKEGGDGLNMFTKDTLVRDGGMTDYEVLINYFNSDTFAERLAAGVYDKWSGEGRITISADEATQPVKKDALQTSVDAAKALNEADYTATSWAALQTALADAEAVLAKADATQAEVDAAAAALDAAVAALKPAGATESTYVLAAEIKDGDEVIIYSPKGYAVENDNYNDWYLTAAAVEVADNKIVTDNSRITWTVHIDADGCYSFTNGDNAITAWQSGDYVEVTNNKNHDGADILWNLTVANADTSLYYISSKTVTGYDRTGYLECYKKTIGGVDGMYMTGYTPKEGALNETDYGFQFYVKSAEEAEPEKPTGAYVAIYNAANGKAMTTESYTYTSSSGSTKDELAAANASLNGEGKLVTEATNVALFEVIKADDGTVTFKTADGKYLYADGTHVRLVDTEGEYTKFILTDEGYIQCATAQYNGKPQYIEYFSNYFTVYSMGTNTAIYIFSLVELAD